METKLCGHREGGRESQEVCSLRVTMSVPLEVGSVLLGDCPGGSDPGERPRTKVCLVEGVLLP